MRSAVSILVALVLVAGCSLMPPAGTRPIVAQVRNTEAFPIQLAVRTADGIVQGGAQPSSLAAGGSGAITFFVPAGEDWWITVNDTEMFYATDVLEFANLDCRALQMEVSTDGSGAIGC